MDRSTRAFILASLAWLCLGAALGVAMTLAWGSPALLRFAHLHLLLLGFMAMMVYGVGYFILPRFNGTTLRWPGLVVPHFWASNLGMLGLAFAAAEFRPLFALVSLGGVLLFAVNMAATLLGAPTPAAREAARPMAAPAAATATSALITGRETVGEVLQAHPELEETIRHFFGDGCFTCPGQATESLEQAARMHNIEPGLLVEALRARLGG